MELWARGPGPTLGIRDFLRKVSFEVASSYASWAADLPNVGQNYAVAAAVLEILDFISTCLDFILAYSTDSEVLSDAEVSGFVARLP